MHILTIVLRLIHIFFGALWFGAALLMFFYISPTIAAIGDAGPKFMGYLVKSKRITVFMSVLAGLTAAAGAGLYWIDSKGFTSKWMHSGPGTIFTIGAVFGLIGFIYGILVGTNIKKMVEAGSQIQGKPTEEQMSQIQGIQKKLQTVGPISTYSLIISMICMSLARYWF